MPRSTRSGKGTKNLHQPQNDRKPKLDNVYTDENMYDSLPDDDESDVSVAEVINRTKRQKSSHIFAPPQAYPRTNTTTDGQQKIPIQTRKVTPPPIVIQGTRMAQLAECLRPLNLNTDKMQYRITSFGIKIMTYDTKTYDQVMKHVKSENSSLKGFSHAPRDEKMIRICLYGLYAMDTDLLDTELKKNGFQTQKIRKMYENPKNPDETIYLLYFYKKQQVTVEKLNSITGLFHLRTKFKYYRSNTTKFTQCSNCQSLGHGTSHCFKAPICVRCAKSHRSADCDLIEKLMDGVHNPPKPQISVDKLKCALCDKQGHSAAWSQCEVKLAYQQKLTTARMKSSTAPRQHREAKLFQQSDFPAMKSSKVHPLQTTYHQYREAPAASQRPWIPEIETNLMSLRQCHDMINFFTAELLKCTTVQEQIATITRLSLHAAEKAMSKLNQP